MFGVSAGAEGVGGSRRRIRFVSGDLVPQQQAAVAHQLQSPDVFGRRRVSRQTLRRVQFEIEEAQVSLFKVERAKQTAIAGMLAENQARTLADALCGDSVEARMAADDYIKALHVAGVNQVYKAAS